MWFFFLVVLTTCHVPYKFSGLGPVSNFDTWPRTEDINPQSISEMEADDSMLAASPSYLTGLPDSAVATEGGGGGKGGKKGGKARKGGKGGKAGGSDAEAKVGPGIQCHSCLFVVLHACTCICGLLHVHLP